MVNLAARKMLTRRFWAPILLEWLTNFERQSRRRFSGRQRVAPRRASSEGVGNDLLWLNGY
jgi:hypothetical protein